MLYVSEHHDARKSHHSSSSGLVECAGNYKFEIMCYNVPSCVIVTGRVSSTLLCQHCINNRQLKTRSIIAGTHAQQTDSDVTIGLCAVSDTNVAYAILIRHKKMSKREVKILSAAIATVGYLFTYPFFTVVRHCLIAKTLLYISFFADSKSGS